MNTMVGLLILWSTSCSCIIICLFKYLKQNVPWISSRDIDFEVVIVDDGSPDGTQDIIKQLQNVYGDDLIVSLVRLSYW